MENIPWESTEMPSTPSSQSPSPPAPVPTAKPQQRKRQLTQAEKANIQRFHQENPFVTHNHIAGLFGLERSTVTKILGQAQIDLGPQPLPDQQSCNAGLNAFAPRSSMDFGSVQSTVTPSKMQRALFQWAQQTQRAGIRVTKPMLRQEAASLAAMAWTERRPSTGSGQYMDRQQSTASSRSSSSMSNTWDNCWSPNMSPYNPSTPGSCSPHRSSYAVPTDPTNISPITMNDIVSACGTTNQFLFDNGVFDPSIPLPPTVDEARGALATIQEYLKQGDRLTPFDFLCLEHLRERLPGSIFQDAPRTPPEEHSWDDLFAQTNCSSVLTPTIGS